MMVYLVATWTVLGRIFLSKNRSWVLIQLQHFVGIIMFFSEVSQRGPDVEVDLPHKSMFTGSISGFHRNHLDHSPSDTIVRFKIHHASDRREYKVSFAGKSK